MIIIKPAKLNDRLLINELAHSIWPIAYKDIISANQMKYMLELIYSPSSIKKQMKELGHKFIIAYANENPAGFASYSIKINSLDTFRLHKIYVLYGEQGKGIGNLLLDKVIELAKSKGAKFLELNVNRRNQALKFYKKTGFKIIAKEDIDIDHGYFMNDYIMQKKL